jgi:acylphosphatase
MNFDLKGAVQKAKDGAVELGAQKAAEAMNQANQLLMLLQEAGYKVGELEVEVSVPPTITINLKPGPMTNDNKLDGVFQANRDNEMLALVLGTLIQANKLRQLVKLETIELKDAKIVLKTSPSISLHWKEKAAASAAATS